VKGVPSAQVMPSFSVYEIEVGVDSQLSARKGTTSPSGVV
jgi:hypothetical protein